MRGPKTTFYAIAMVASLSVFTVLPALAQTGVGDGHHRMMGHDGMMRHDCPMMGMMMPGREARIDERLSKLKQKLGITPAQEPAWMAYMAAARKNVEAHQGMHQAMMQAMQSKTPLERLDGQITAVESHAALLKSIKPALAALYDVLNADQKVTANAALTGRGCMM